MKVDFDPTTDSPPEPHYFEGFKPPLRDRSPVGPRQVYALLGYYLALLVGSVALLSLLVSRENSLATTSLARMGFVGSGAVVGSVLYQVRMLYAHYIKDSDFDSKWIGKYISAPWEAVALALIVLSLIQGGGVVLGTGKFELSPGGNYAAFGLGGLIGFGIREVVGWLGNLVQTMFPTKPKQ